MPGTLACATSARTKRDVANLPSLLVAPAGQMPTGDASSIQPFVLSY